MPKVAVPGAMEKFKKHDVGALQFVHIIDAH